MRLITLNIWCGMLPEKLLEFVKAKGPDTDVFCFQEVLDNKKGVPSGTFKGGTEDIVSRFKEALPDFVGYSSIPQPNEVGIATFVKRSWKIEKVEEDYVYGKKDSMIGNDWRTIGKSMLYTRISNGDTYNIWNVHGKFVAMEKKDYPETLEQARNIERIISAVSGKRILCGDFNLDPNTEGVAMFERIPLRNLVKEYNVTSTRTKLYEFWETQKFADYIMPSIDIKVNDFKVLDDVVSDHNALLLDCT